jgi:hypothetical protein
MNGKIILAGLMFASLAAATSVRAADKVGVPACDEFLTKYEACVTAKVPAAQQSMMKTQIDQIRNGWAEAAKNASTKPTLEASCKQTGEQMKAAVQAYGCSF